MIVASKDALRLYLAESFAGVISTFSPSLSTGSTTTATAFPSLLPTAIILVKFVRRLL